MCEGWYKCSGNRNGLIIWNSSLEYKHGRFETHQINPPLSSSNNLTITWSCSFRWTSIALLNRNHGTSISLVGSQPPVQWDYFYHDNFFLIPTLSFSPIVVHFEYCNIHFTARNEYFIIPWTMTFAYPIALIFSIHILHLQE